MLCAPTGHVSEIMGDKGAWSMVKWTEAYGPIFKLQFLDAFTVVLTDPDTIARVTRKTGEAMATGQSVVAGPTAAAAKLFAFTVVLTDPDTMLGRLREVARQCSSSFGSTAAVSVKQQQQKNLWHGVLASGHSLHCACIRKGAIIICSWPGADSKTGCPLIAGWMQHVLAQLS